MRVCKQIIKKRLRARACVRVCATERVRVGYWGTSHYHYCSNKTSLHFLPFPCMRLFVSLLLTYRLIDLFLCLFICLVCLFVFLGSLKRMRLRLGATDCLPFMDNT